MFKVTGVEGEHMTREQTLDGVEAIIGKSDVVDKPPAEAQPVKRHQPPLHPHQRKMTPQVMMLLPMTTMLQKLTAEPKRLPRRNNGR